MDSFVDDEPPIEPPEQRRERLRAIAKERVRALIAQPQSFQLSGNQGSGVDRNVYTGPRGGRYTREDTKDGRPYRRYF
jgi:hypothetical protein